jgi:hypothetical protein
MFSKSATGIDDSCYLRRGTITRWASRPVRWAECNKRRIKILLTGCAVKPIRAMY